MALRDINLLDPDWVRRRTLTRHLSFWAVCLLAGLALIGAVHLQVHSALAKKKAGMSLGSAQNRLAAAGDAFKRLQAELDALNRHHGAVKAIIRGPAYSNILLALSDRMNASTWLTELQVSSGRSEDPAVGVMLTGSSCSHEALGDLLNRLAADRFFSEVRLKYTREIEAATGRSPCGTPSLIQFQITGQVPKG